MVQALNKTDRNIRRSGEGLETQLRQEAQKGRNGWRPTHMERERGRVPKKGLEQGARGREMVLAGGPEDAVGACSTLDQRKTVRRKKPFKRAPLWRRGVHGVYDTSQLSPLKNFPKKDRNYPEKKKHLSLYKR